jgi:aryl-alcohol dehydrogenase-like predicted oxidoreductase
MLKYGILNQYAGKEALPLCEEHDIGVLNMAVIREKLPDPELLSTQIKNWKREGLISESDISSTDPLGWLVAGEVGSIVDAGYKFAADHRAISTVLTGTSKISHLESNIQALEDPTLPDHHRERLERIFGEIAIYI